MPLHLDEFQRQEFQGYVETVPPKKNYALAKFFPNEEIFDVEFAYNVISGGYNVMASITGWDAGSPLRDKGTLARMTGELGKIHHGFHLTEKEMLSYNRPRMDAERKKVVDSIYNNTDKLITGIYDREEWFRARAVYTGAISYSENDVKIDVDFKNGVNPTAVTKSWISDQTADILTDLKTAVQSFRDANGGANPVEMHISPAVETAFMKNAQLKTMVYGNSTDGRIITRDQVQALFGSLDLPPYTVITDTVVINNAGQTEKLIDDNRVVLLGDDLGKTLIGPTAEKEYEPGIYVVPMIQETNPPKQEVYVGETCFPALERPSAVYRLTV
jgi:hypothetical protein